MADDRKTDSEDLNYRWLANVRHNSSFSMQIYALNLDYTRVDANDYDYFTDFHPDRLACWSITS